MTESEIYRMDLYEAAYWIDAAGYTTVMDVLTNPDHVFLRHLRPALDAIHLSALDRLCMAFYYVDLIYATTIVMCGLEESPPIGIGEDGVYLYLDRDS